MINNRKDFAICLQKFFIEYLSVERGSSSHTIRSYRDTFALLLIFFKEQHMKDPNKISLSMLDKELVLSFLEWLEKSRNVSVSTRNQRCAALRTFSKYMMYMEPNNLAQWKEVCSIKAKHNKIKTVGFLSIEAMTKLLEQIPVDTRQGRRDLTLISMLYYTGARVGELIELTPTSIRLTEPSVVELYGKGSKKRIVPIENQLANLLKKYLAESNLDRPEVKGHPLFFNSRHEKLTTPGVTYVIEKYVSPIKKLDPELILCKVTPHVFRHSRAVHLLEAGVNLIIIRDLLGHVSIQTTEIYARVSSKSKTKALEEAFSSIGIIEPEVKNWQQNNKLKEFLKGLV